MTKFPVPSFQFRVIGRLILVVALSATVHAQSRTQIDAFMTQLRSAVAADDRAKVVTLFAYPSTVNMSGLRMPLTSSAALLQLYDQIFTPAMRAEIQKSDPVGVSLTIVNGQVKIAQLSVPKADEAGDAVLGAGSKRPRPTSAEPRRIQLKVGPRPTQLAGTLAGGAVDAYVVYVPKGMLLDVRLERVGMAATISVVNEVSGFPLNPNVHGRSLTVIGRAMVAGDYKIDVRRTPGGAGDDDQPLSYLLSVSAR